MRALRQLPLLAIFAIANATLVPGPWPASSAEPAAGGELETASIPDLSGLWRHPSRPGVERRASGPGPGLNLSREDGKCNYYQLVGDYANPILKPWAADVVKKFGETSKTGLVFPSPANQCWPEPVPFIYKNF